MREIKYQAYDPANAKMISWDTCILHHIMPGQAGWYWREYTGLHDKNGKEIYEGDIVQHSCGDRFQVEQTPGGWNPFIDNMTTDNSYRYEVIGNIYENPPEVK